MLQLDLIIEVLIDIYKEEFPFEIFFKALMIFDMFLYKNTTQFNENELSYYTAMALFVAVKLKSVIIFDLKDFLRICFSQVSDKMIEKAISVETDLLGIIFFDINNWSYFDLICYHLSKIFNTDDSKNYFKLEKMIHSLFILLILDYSIYDHN